MEEWRLPAIVIGQGIFVAMWGAMPWWRQWIGRALMLKSTALLISFGAIWWARHGTLPDIAWDVLEWLILVGVWAQVVALVREVAAARRERRLVDGLKR